MALQETARAASGRRQTAQPARRGGRMTDERRRKILEVAAALFLEKGYTDVSIDEIVARAGGSKGTIYTWFGGKEGLFEAVVKQLCLEVTISIDVKTTGSVAAQLSHIGATFLTMVLTPRILDLHRLMVSMGRTFPAAGRTFFAAGPATAYKTVATWIETQQRAGVIGAGDPYRLAVLFLDMLIGEHQLGLLMSLPKKSQGAKIKETVRYAVDLFLNGCRSRAG